MSEPNNNAQPSPVGGSKLSTIFLVVLGLHIVLIVAFSAYHLLKGDSAGEPKSAAMADSEQTLTESTPPGQAGVSEQPTVETQQAEVTTRNPEVLPPEATSPSMPASNDPIWTRVPAPSENREEVVKPAQTPGVPVAVSPRVEMTVNEKSYTVAKGDSLARIARMHGVSVAELKSANNMTGDMIKIGQVMQVPSVRSATTSSETVAAVKSVPATAPVVKRAIEAGTNYTVGKGDTLWKIARKFNVKPQQLAEANGITDPSKLKVGMVLRLPSTVEKQDMAKPPVRPEPVPVNTDMAMVPR